MLILKLLCALAVQAKADQQVLAGEKGMPGPFIPIMRLRQVCTHYSLLPQDLQLMLLGGGSSSESDEAAQDGTVVSCADALERIQAKHTPSTKMKRMLSIVKVTT